MIGADPRFLRALLLNAVWINVSEVFRYFVFVMPMMRAAFPESLGVAPMNVGVFLSWGVWDAILILTVTGVCWLWFARFGARLRSAVMAGTAVWLGVFVILWLGLYNMNLAPLGVVAIALPLAWAEMVAAALLARWAFNADRPGPARQVACSGRRFGTPTPSRSPGPEARPSK